MPPAKGTDDTSPIYWLREDFKELRGGFGEMREDFGKVAGAVERIGAQVDRHCSDKGIHLNGKKSDPSIVPPPLSRGGGSGDAKATALFWFARLAPVLFAIGVLVGAYVVSGSGDESVRALRAVSESIAKIQRDVDTVKKDVKADEEMLAEAAAPPEQK